MHRDIKDVKMEKNVFKLVKYGNFEQITFESKLSFYLNNLETCKVVFYKLIIINKLIFIPRRSTTLI